MLDDAELLLGCRLLVVAKRRGSGVYAGLKVIICVVGVVVGK